MRERDAIQEPLADPKWVEQQVEKSIRRISGNQARFHHTVRRPDLQGMTFGGLHETSEEAAAALKRLAIVCHGSAWSDIKTTSGKPYEYDQSQADQFAEKWRRLGVVVELNQGEKYKPWGARFYIYSHGVDDGTHGSKRKG